MFMEPDTKYKGLMAAILAFILIFCSPISMADQYSNKVFQLAIKAYYRAKSEGYTTSKYLTIVDYSLPSNSKRLWVYNTETHMVIFNTYVAHGAGSGSLYSVRFSNEPGSSESSLGLMKTGKTFIGHEGESLFLIGLEPGYNSNIYKRHIIMHPAPYVNENHVGRSLGCLALNEDIAPLIINTIKNGSLIFCYYPDSDWLQHSKFLNYGFF